MSISPNLIYLLLETMVRDYCQTLKCCAVGKVGESYVCYPKLGDQSREEDPHKGRTWAEEKKAVKVWLLIFFLFSSNG